MTRCERAEWHAPTPTEPFACTTGVPNVAKRTRRMEVPAAHSTAREPPCGTTWVCTSACGANGGGAWRPPAAEAEADLPSRRPRLRRRWPRPSARRARGESRGVRRGGTVATVEAAAAVAVATAGVMVGTGPSRVIAANDASTVAIVPPTERWRVTKVAPAARSATSRKIDPATSTPRWAPPHHSEEPSSASPAISSSSYSSGSSSSLSWVLSSSVFRSARGMIWPMRCDVASATRPHTPQGCLCCGV